MHIVAPGRAVCHSGTHYGPGDVLPFEPGAALLADGAVIESAPEPAEDPAPAPKPKRRRGKR